PRLPRAPATRRPRPAARAPRRRRRPAYGSTKNSGSGSSCPRVRLHGELRPHGEAVTCSATPRRRGSARADLAGLVAESGRGLPDWIPDALRTPLASLGAELPELEQLQPERLDPGKQREE